MYITIFSVPITSSIIVGIFGRYFGVYGSIYILIISIVYSSIMSIICFYEVIYCGSIISIYINVFINTYINNVYSIMYIDNICISFLFTIVIVSMCVFIFSIIYMWNDKYIIRFLVYILLFVSSMLYLIMYDSYINIFIGWEYIAVFSYMLINFWYKRINSNMAAIKAFSINRICDVVFTILLAIIINIIGIDSIYYLQSIIYNSNYITIYYIGIIILLSTIGKSAQFGFHIWLPSSMEGYLLVNIV